MSSVASDDHARVAQPSQTGAGVRLALWDIQSPINFGMLLRVAETYRVPVAAYGRDHSQSTTTRDFACGALERVGFRKLDSLSHLQTWKTPGRLIATSIESGAQSLLDFRFSPGDVVVLGNEYDGLPAEIADRADDRLIIPMAEVWTPKPVSESPIDPARTAPVARDGRPNLNVAMAGGIICYAAFAQALRRRA